jgi:hypothetical protein
VNAVFNGHVHAYEKSYQNDIHYAVLGIGGGPSFLLAEEKIDGYRNSFENTLGYARVTVNGAEASMDVIKVADIYENEVTQIYPPNTIFETVNLAQESVASTPSITATATLNMPMVGIDIDRDSIDYGDVAPGKSSTVETVGVTNVGTVDCDVFFEVNGADAAAQNFYEASLYVDGSLYNIAATIASIEVEGSEDIDIQLQVPLSWSEVGAQEATFVFWAEAA